MNSSEDQRDIIKFSIQAEIRVITEMLKEVPEESTMERHSLKNRLNSAKKELAQLNAQ